MAHRKRFSANLIPLPRPRPIRPPTPRVGQDGPEAVRFRCSSKEEQSAMRHLFRTHAWVVAAALVQLAAGKPLNLASGATSRRS